MVQQTDRQRISLVRPLRSIAVPQHAGPLPACNGVVPWSADNQLVPRWQQLVYQLELLRPVFADLDLLAIAYLNSPRSTAGTTATDPERLLQWLEQTMTLSDEQRDYVTYQRARQRLARQMCVMRLEHARFQDVARLCQRHASDLELHTTARLRLNPLRTWAQLISSALLDQESSAPANVLLFASGDGVASAVLELEGQALLNELEDWEPCTLHEWSDWSQLAGHERLVAFCRDLLELGAIAWT